MGKEVVMSPFEREGYIQKATSIIATIGVASVSLGMAFSPAAISAGFLLCLVAAILSAPMFFRHAIGSWVGFSFLLLAIWTLINGVVMPGLLEAVSFDAKGVWHTLRIVGLGTLVVGWSIVISRLRLRGYLALALVGLIIALGSEALESGLSIFDISGRLRFFRSPNQLGHLGATGLLATLTILVPIALQSSKGRERDVKPATRALMCALPVIVGPLSLWLFIGSYSRSAWLAFIVSIVFIGALRAIKWHNLSQPLKYAVVPYTLVAVLIGALVISVAGNEIGNRLAQESETVSSLVQGDFSDLPRGSFSARIAIWQVGIARVAEQPITGWGAGSISQLMERSYEEGPLWSKWGHFHNLYLNMAVALGVPAMALWCFAMYTSLWGAFQYYSQEDTLLGWFLLSWGIMFAVASFFQIRMYTTEDAAYFVFLTSLIFSGYVKAKIDCVAGEDKNH